MNADQISGFVRSLVLALGGLLAGFGLFANVSADTWTTIGGAAAAVAGVVWSWWVNRNKAIVQSAAAIVPVSAAAQASVGIETKIEPKA